MADNDAFRELIKERLLTLDPTMDVSDGSPADTLVVSPIVTALGADPEGMDTQDFIETRINQEYPDLSTEEGVFVSDALIKPLTPIVESYSREVERVKIGQSFNNADLMTEDQASDLLANFFLEFRGGGYAIGTARVYFSNPTQVTFGSAVRVSTSGGLNFLPSSVQSVTANQMATQRQGSMYYADITVRGEQPGDDYNVDIGEITTISGVDGAVRVTNLFAFEGGIARETVEEAVVRGEKALTERSLTSSRGIFTRLMDLYPDSLRTLQPIGMGDPEMQRDIITGAGEGHVVSSGTAFIVGKWILYFGMYEDRGWLGDEGIEVGQEIDLNYWEMLYGVPSYEQHERFTIDHIVLNTRDLIPTMPSTILMQISGNPTPTQTVNGGTVPNFLPGVFATIRTTGKIQISDIPGGIVGPTTENGTLEINDGEVHVGGKHDIWVRPISDTARLATIDELQDEEPILSGDYLITQGATGGDDANRVEFNSPGLDLLSLGVDETMILAIINGADAGVYAILKVTSDYLYLDANLTADETDLVFKVIDEVQHDLINPKKVRVPFGVDAPGNDLQTVIGEERVILGTNIITFGAVEGDTFEILEGPDAGRYTIIEFDTSGGGTTPVLDRAMGVSNSGLSYTVYEAQEVVQRPLVRIRPEGVRLLDSADQTTDATIPPALPVDARSLYKFTGAEHVCDGRWGFVAPDPGSAFEPTSSGSCSLNDYLNDEFDRLVTAGEMTALAAETIGIFLGYQMKIGCYTDECLPCEGGTIACVRMTNERLHIAFEPNTDWITYANDWITWMQTVVQQLFLTNFKALPTDIDTEGISWMFDTPVWVDTVETPLWQFEICIPPEFFDCCSNTWISLPEFNVDLIAEAIRDTLGTDGLENLHLLFEKEFLQDVGDILGGADDPCALQANPGDVLTVTEGPNQGGYLIRDVFKYQMVLPTTDAPPAPDYVDAMAWTNSLPILTIGVITIEGEFPVETCGALCEFFGESFPPTFNLPEPGVFDGTCEDPPGTPMDPFAWVVQFFNWFFNFLSSLGYDVPTEFDIDWGDFFQSAIEIMFPSYGVGIPTCKNTVRVYWPEPTTAEFEGGLQCVYDEANNREFRAGQAQFSATVGATELLFAASPDIDPHMLIPFRDTVDEIDRLDWPRELGITSAPPGADCLFTDLTMSAPLALGLQPLRDILRIHEEVFLDPFITDKTRRPALATTAGSAVVRLLTSFGHDIINDDVIQIGDLIFIEEGVDADGFVVVDRVSATEFELDRPLTESTPTILRQGDDGSFDGTAGNPDDLRFTSAASPFTNDDIGRYLTVYSTTDQQDDGSWEIKSVDAGGAYVELDRQFVGVEANVRWAVTAAPAEDPDDTDAGGTELVALRPFRIYNGTATDWLITDVDTHLDVETAVFHVEEEGGGAGEPTDGVGQPYAILRPGIQRITSTQMSENRENGLYYFDVLVTSLGSLDVFNLAQGTKMEPVFGTYKSDGYRYEVENNNFTFSAYEEVRLVFSPKFLPVGEEDRQESFLPTRGQKLQLSYDYSGLVAQIQQLMLGDLERQLVSDPLVRHFLPSYFYFTATYSGGSKESVVAQDIIDFVNSLRPVDELSLAKIEDLFRQRSVTDWTHPMELITLTHDIDRRMVVERSNDRIGGTATVLYNGTNRISFITPGKDQSSQDEEDVPAGERIYLTRTVQVVNLE